MAAPTLDQFLKAGYKIKDLLDAISKSDPKAGKLIGQALAGGYSLNEIGNGIFRALETEKRQKRSRMQEGIRDPRSMRERQLEAEVDRARAGKTPASLLGGALGAAGGFALGGPAGAATGAAAGLTGVSDLIDRYAQRVEEGSSMGLGDFIKAGAKAAGSGALASQLLSLGQSIYGPSDAVRQPSEEAQEAPAQVLVGSEKAAVKSDAIREMSSDEAANILKQAGQFERAATIAKNNPDDVVARAMELTINKNFNKEIQKQYGKGIAEITLTAMPLLREGGAETQETVQVEKTQPAGSYEGMEKAVESEALQEMRQPGKPDVKRLDMERDPIGQAYQSLMQIPEATQKLGKIAPFASALKSSNVRGATYDADTQKMRVVFAPKAGRKGGTVYEYDGIDLETFKSMTGGEAKPLTEGESEFGIWFNEKNPSVGAAFHKFIKTNPDKFPYQKQEPSGYRVDEKQLIEADRTFLGASLFEPFKAARERGKQLQKGSALRQLEPALKSMDDEFVADIVQFLEEKLKSKLKTPPKVSRLQKEFRKEFL